MAAAAGMSHQTGEEILRKVGRAKEALGEVINT
jgi:hypothetical protein